MLIQAEQVYKHYQTSSIFSHFNPPIRAVDGVSLNIESSKIIGIVGESGSGKTTLARLLIRLLEPSSGRVLFQGKPLQEFSKSQMREFRSQVQIIFQDPFDSLDPRMCIFDIVKEPLKAQRLPMSRAHAEQVVADALNAVRLEPPASFLSRYPHELSGGQRQRVAIARTLVLRPKLIIADEPVSMLDTSVRAEILNLIRELREKHGIAFIVITHDIPVARQIADELVVMYLGRIVEQGETDALIRKPLHPYTQALISAVPKLTQLRNTPLPTGEIPSAIKIPTGCRFHPRCPFKFEPCDRQEPQLLEVNPGQYVACFLHKQPT